jgi:hypothetical protein
MFLWLCIILTAIMVMTPKVTKDKQKRTVTWLWTPDKILMVIIAWVMYWLS